MEIRSSTSFDGTHHLEYKDTGKSHIYTLNGKRVPGATTVGAAYPKGEGLIKWLVKQGIKEYEERTQLRRAGAIGTVVHAYAEARMNGKEYPISVDTADYTTIMGCIKQYDRWAAAHPDDKLLMAEALLASPELQVASQIDLLLERNGEKIIRDYKTGKKVYVSALHQTALYRIMLREWSGIICDRLEILKFSKEPNTVPFEVCTVTNAGIEINGQFIERMGLLDELEAQTIRNVLTYRHQQKVEKLLSDYYEDHRG